MRVFGTFGHGAGPRAVLDVANGGLLMKIAVTTSGTDLDSPFETRFGRSPGFVVFDTESGEAVAVDNGAGASAGHGAGPRAAEAIAGAGAEVVLTGNCGPKAYQALRAAGIKVFVGSASTVRDAIEKFQAGQMQEFTGA